MLNLNLKDNQETVKFFIKSILFYNATVTFWHEYCL